MSASAFEAILARAAAVLVHTTPAADRIYRARDDAFAAEETPAINIRRDNTSGEVLGSRGERHVLEFTLACIAAGTNWESSADAVHMAAHQQLMSDPDLGVLGHGLRCTSTEIQDDSADQPVGRITARYQMQVFIRPGDLTRAIN